MFPSPSRLPVLHVAHLTYNFFSPSLDVALSVAIFNISLFITFHRRIAFIIPCCTPVSLFRVIFFYSAVSGSFQLLYTFRRARLLYTIRHFIFLANLNYILHNNATDCNSVPPSLSLSLSSTVSDSRPSISVSLGQTGTWRQTYLYEF